MFEFSRKIRYHARVAHSFSQIQKTMSPSSKLVLIYSAGFDNIGIDDLSDGRKGIYVYSGSYHDLERVIEGDSIIFFQTNKRQAYLFDFHESYRVNENNSFYIEFPQDPRQFQISIEDFKNLYFIDIDGIRAWVRSPLSSGRNVLLLERRHILSQFLDTDAITECLQSNLSYARRYLISATPTIPHQDSHAVHLAYDPETGIFGKEYSVFAPE